jgi:ElaB/YqjD/DUF883 family membrane-anchored ribosome-binding protein
MKIKDNVIKNKTVKKRRAKKGGKPFTLLQEKDFKELDDLMLKNLDLIIKKFQSELDGFLDSEDYKNLTTVSSVKRSELMNKHRNLTTYLTNFKDIHAKYKNLVDIINRYKTDADLSKISKEIKPILEELSKSISKFSNINPSDLQELNKHLQDFTQIVITTRGLFGPKKFISISDPIKTIIDDLEAELHNLDENIKQLIIENGPSIPDDIYTKNREYVKTLYTGIKKELSTLIEEYYKTNKIIVKLEDEIQKSTDAVKKAEKQRELNYEQSRLKKYEQIRYNPIKININEVNTKIKVIMDELEELNATHNRPTFIEKAKHKKRELPYKAHEAKYNMISSIKGVVK